MGTVTASIGERLHRARLRLKGFAYSGPGRDRWQHPDRVVAALALRPGQRVADLGAGGGYFTLRLARAVGPEGRVYAVDTDPDMRELVADRAARDGRGNVVPVAARPEDPALPEPVDLVLLVNAFHHLPEPAGYAATLAGHLRPGGRVAVVEAEPRRLLFGHATAPERIRTTMAAAGYVLQEEHRFLPRQSFQTFRPERPGG
jgi:SAM-dependent methyltransferase